MRPGPSQVSPRRGGRHAHTVPPSESASSLPPRGPLASHVRRGDDVGERPGEGGAVEPHEPSQPSQLSQRRTLIIIGALLLGMLLAALDQTIVATALPTIAGDLHGLSHLSWVVTAYLLAATVSTPLWGKLGDLYGRKAFFQAAILIFLAGSALSGLAHSMLELIVFRAVQGIGGGGLLTGAPAIVAHGLPPREPSAWGGGGRGAGPRLGGRRAGGGRAGLAVGAVRHPGFPRHWRGGVRGRIRDVRRPHVPAAVHADREGRQPDRLRPAAAAD